MSSVSRSSLSSKNDRARGRSPAVRGNQPEIVVDEGNGGGPPRFPVEDTRLEKLGFGGIQVSAIGVHHSHAVVSLRLALGIARRSERMESSGVCVERLAGRRHLRQDRSSLEVQLGEELGVSPNPRFIESREGVFRPACQGEGACQRHGGHRCQRPIACRQRRCDRILQIADGLRQGGRQACGQAQRAQRGRQCSIVARRSDPLGQAPPLGQDAQRIVVCPVEELLCGLLMVGGLAHGALWSLQTQGRSNGSAVFLRRQPGDKGWRAVLDSPRGARSHSGFPIKPLTVGTRVHGVFGRRLRTDAGDHEAPLDDLGDHGAHCAVTPTTTTTTAAAPTTSPPVMIPPMAGTPGEECFYLNRLVAAPHGVLTAADAPSFGLALLGPAEIEAQLDLYLHPSEVPVAFEGSLNAVGATIDGFVDLFEITDGSDPLARAQQLRTDHGIEAAPVHVAASAGHWPFKPGEDAVALPDVTLMAEDTDITGVIAVVDTGLVQTGLPWLDPHVTIDDPIDIDPYIDSHAVGGHGTFIASLVRLIAPPTRVSMARARAVDPAKVTAHPEHPVPTDAIFSSELHVTEALARLLARHSEDPTPVHALNLSLGTYGCLLPDVSGQPIIPIPTMAGALQQWVVTHPNAAITAASGNEPFSTPFWPAALNQAFFGLRGSGRVGLRRGSRSCR